jgi:hypothetical protein
MKSTVLRIKASSDAFVYAQTMPKLEFLSSFRGGEQRQKAFHYSRAGGGEDTKRD